MCGLSSKVDIFSRGIAYVRMGQKLTSRASINSSAKCHKRTWNPQRSAVVGVARLVCQILYQQGEHEHGGQEREPEQETIKVIHVSVP